MSIKIQSFSDIVTNSSSEVFIISTDKECKECVADDIKEILNVILKALGYDDCEEIFTVEIAEKAYSDNDWDYQVAEGDILITSVEDNSIPYSIINLLEYELQYCPAMEEKISNVERIHLG